MYRGPFYWATAQAGLSPVSLVITRRRDIKLILLPFRVCRKVIDNLAVAGVIIPQGVMPLYLISGDLSMMLCFYGLSEQGTAA